MDWDLRPDNRLFVAFDLPDGLRIPLADLADRVAAEHAEARPVPVGNLHMTACFIGGVGADADPAALAALFDAMVGPVHRVRIGVVLARPRPAAARLLAVTLTDDAGTLAAHARRIREASARLLGPGEAERPFWPHVTVARFRRPTRVRRYPWSEGEHVFAIDRVTLYDSHIVPGRSPSYRALMTVPLGRLVERNGTNG